jgi:hypothetical protein
MFFSQAPTQVRTVRTQQVTGRRPCDRVGTFRPWFKIAHSHPDGEERASALGDETHGKLSVRVLLNFCDASRVVYPDWATERSDGSLTTLFCYCRHVMLCASKRRAKLQRCLR